MAARPANVSQPTLSRQVRGLEERVGVRLVERSTTGAVLTPISRSIVATARRMLSDARDIIALAGGASDSRAGTLKLGTTPTLGSYLLSPIIAELHRTAPRLRLHVCEGIPTNRCSNSREGTLMSCWGRCR